MKRTITKTQEYTESFRTAKVSGMFDLSPSKKLSRTWEIELPINEHPWNIGLIVGSSGSGKTTIAKEFFPENYINRFNWNNKSIVDNFDKGLDIKDIINALCHVGFSSPPNWLLPYDKLSNGQQFRVDLTRALLNKKDLIVIDEFTSVVDRVVAKTSCVAINKTINKLKSKKLIAVSCHSDIIEWLQPNWVFDVDQNFFKWVRLRRPKLEIKIHELGKGHKTKIWQIFKHHHYLSGNICLGAICFVATLNGNICGFTSARPSPVCTGTYLYQEHRTVVLPDYQGMGVGNKISEFLGQYVWDRYHKILRSTTSHPAMIFYRNKSLKWQLLRDPKVVHKAHANSMRAKSACNRLTASFKFIPDR